ncbi:MAG: hypothetical protein NDI61_05325, partial [Bdellovibrionaceae bacterium]|nr:hypothetical protein [Pseudobdellovibrionaceae bacterium]
GDGGRFYITQRDGSASQSVIVSGWKPLDTEELALGPCDQKRTCLFLADMGDNREARSSIDIWLVEEVVRFGEQVNAVRKLTLRYPDRAHNAEAFAVHPNGDLFIVTKEMTKEKKAQTAHVFRLPAQSWQTSQPSNQNASQVSSQVLSRASQKDRILTLEPWGHLDVPAIVGASGYEGLVTGMSFSPKGERLLLLTYDKALEIAWDLSKGPWAGAQALATSGQLSVIGIRRLKQQEAISYDENGRDFIYTTEQVKALGNAAGDAEILSMRCK